MTTKRPTRYRGYIDTAKHKSLIKKYDEVNRMLYGMIDKAEKFCR